MPSKQEEIRNVLIDILDGTETVYTDEENRPRGYVDEILGYLHSQGLRLPDGEALIDETNE